MLKKWLRSWLGIESLVSVEHTPTEEAAPVVAELPTDTIVLPTADPQVRIVAIGMKSNNEVKLELDWDEGFIEILKANGYTGTDDTQIIQRWLAHLSKDIHEEINEQPYV